MAAGFCEPPAGVGGAAEVGHHAEGGSFGIQDGLIGFRRGAEIVGDIGFRNAAIIRAGVVDAGADRGRAAAGADEALDGHGQLRGIGCSPGDEPVIEGLLLYVGQDLDGPSGPGAILVGKLLIYIVVVVQGQANLLEIVDALRACSGLADFLNGRQEQADEDGNDGDDHQQLDQRKADMRRPPRGIQEHGSSHGSPP